MRGSVTNSPAQVPLSLSLTLTLAGQHYTILAYTSLHHTRLGGSSTASQLATHPPAKDRHYFVLT